MRWRGPSYYNSLFNYLHAKYAPAIAVLADDAKIKRAWDEGWEAGWQAAKADSQSDAAAAHDK